MARQETRPREHENRETAGFFRPARRISFYWIAALPSACRVSLRQASEFQREAESNSAIQPMDDLRAEESCPRACFFDDTALRPVKNTALNSPPICRA